MTTTEETATRLFYAVAGAGEAAYRGLRKLPARVEALRERFEPQVRTFREELPGRVEALRAEVPARVTTLVAEARETYGEFVARGEKIVVAARARRAGEADEAGTDVTVAAADAVAVPVKAVKAVRKAVKKAVAPKGRAPQA